MKTKSELRRDKYYKILKQEVEEGTHNEYQLLSKEYVNSSTKVAVLHKECGYEYGISPNSFKRGTRCPKCAGVKKGTIEELRELVEEETNNEYQLLSKEYVNSQTKVKVLHTVCGHEYNVTQSIFKRGSRCPKCSGKLKGSIEDLRKKVEEGTHNEYQLLSKKYVNNKTKVKVLHKECGYAYQVTPYKFKTGNRCPKCSGKLKGTIEELRKIVEDGTNNEYQLISKEYVNNSTKVELLHKVCGYEYSVTPNAFKNGNRCSECFRKLKGTIEELKEIVEEGTNNEYKLLSKEYVNNRTKVKVLHKKCGYEYLVTPSAFKTGNRCPKCYGNNRGTIEELREIVEEGTNNEYQLISKDYVNNYTKVKILHKVCGTCYEATPKNFKKGRRCPNCKSSKGETTIKNILDSLKIKYIREYKIVKNPNTDCYLPIDFAIFNRGKLIGCIEYDGYQHYYPVDHFGGESNYYKTINRDDIKDFWCKFKNIPLLRIPYWEEDVEGLVEKYINNIKNNQAYKDYMLLNMIMD